MSRAGSGCLVAGSAFAEGAARVVYFPDGDRSWPATFPVLNMKVYDTFCEMQGVRPEQAINPVSALEVLEGQVALVHHIMAFEEANQRSTSYHLAKSGRPVFWPIFLGAVSKGQLEVMKKLGDESYAASLADRGCWQVRTSKGLVYELRHSRDLALGRSTMLCSRTLTRSSRPSAGRRTRFWDSFLGIPRRGSQFMFSYVACTMTTFRASTGTSVLSAVQGHTRVSPTADPATLGEPLTKERCRSLGYIFHATHNKNWESIKTEGLELGKTRDPGQSSRIAIHMVYAGGVRGSACWDAHRLWQVLVLLQCEV